MVASWLRRGYPRDAQRLSADIVLQLVAGGDSTATLIKTTTLYLISNYRVLRKLRRELDEAERAGRISSPVVTNKESLQLPYLQAVVRRASGYSCRDTACSSSRSRPAETRSATGSFLGARGLHTASGASSGIPSTGATLTASFPNVGLKSTRRSGASWISSWILRLAWVS